GSARMARPVPGDLADARRRGGRMALHAMGEPTTRSGRRAPRRPRDPPEPNAARRPDLVLLPVLPAGWSVLRGAPVPVCRARALCDRNRCPAPAAVDHAPAGR